MRRFIASSLLYLVASTANAANLEDVFDPKDIKNLFEPYKLGDIEIPNRIVLAAYNRRRTDPKLSVPTEMNAKYYAMRASAGLIVTECTCVAYQGDTYPGTACIYNKEQTEGWKLVTKAVHEKGGRIAVQLWHGGRSSNPGQTGDVVIGPSPITIRGYPLDGNEHVLPKEMTKEEIKKVVEQFRQGAKNAKEAGFDGVQLHGANGYIIDQFLRNSANHRTDEYGGSIENRARFCLEIIDAVSEVFGAGRVGIALSPVGRWLDMYDSDPIPLYKYLLHQLDKRGIAYVELMEPNELIAQPDDYPKAEKQIAEVAKTFRDDFKGPIWLNNRWTPLTAAKALAEGTGDVIAFGTYFVANPDLVDRLKNGWPLTKGPEDPYAGKGEENYLTWGLYNPDKKEKIEK